MTDYSPRQRRAYNAAWRQAKADGKDILSRSARAAAERAAIDPFDSATWPANATPRNIAAYTGTDIADVLAATS